MNGMRPAWRPAALDLIRLPPGLRGCCGSVPPSRHIRHVHDANGQRPTANGHPSPWPPGSMSASAPMPTPIRHPRALRPLIMTCQKHTSRIDADDAPAPPSVMLTLATTHRLAMIRPPHITCLKPPFASLPERVSVTLTLTCCVELVSLLTLSLSFATLGVHPRIRPAWRPAARDLVRLAPGLRGCCGSVPPSRHIASTTPTANGERPTAIRRHDHQNVRQRPHPRPRPCAITEHFDDSS